jgi:hypothetical protein
MFIGDILTNNRENYKYEERIPFEEQGVDEDGD